MPVEEKAGPPFQNAVRSHKIELPIYPNAVRVFKNGVRVFKNFAGVYKTALRVHRNGVRVHKKGVRVYKIADFPNFSVAGDIKTQFPYIGTEEARASEELMEKARSALF